MLFSTDKRLSKTPRKLSLEYKYQVIHSTKRYKYLGCILDPCLNLNDFFDKSYKKASSRLKLLYKMRPYLTTLATMKIYNMMIVTILTYNSLVNLKLTRTQLAKYTSIKNRATQIIGQCDPVEKIENIIKRNACNIVKKCLLKEACENFDDYFKLISHNISTRNNDILLILPKVRLECAKNSFCFMGARLYNTLPREIRESHDINCFKKSLKTLLF